MTFLANFFLALPDIHTPQYHVSLMFVEFDALHHSRSSKAPSSTSLALLPSPSTLGTFEKLNKTLPWLSLTQLVCKSCHLGKYHQSLYSRCDNIPSFVPFDILCYHAWGPSRTPSISHHYYYIDNMKLVLVIT